MRFASGAIQVASLFAFACQPPVSKAFVEIERANTVAENEFVDSEVKDASKTAFHKAKDLPETAKGKLAAIEAKFGIAPGSTSVDARSGRVASLMMSKPVLPGNGHGNRFLWAVSEENDEGNGHGPPKDHKEWSALGVNAVKGWMIENQADLDINAAEELFADGITRTGVHGDGETIQFHLPRTFKNVIVKDSRATATIKNGNIVSVGLEKWGTIPNNFSVEPNISAEEAIDKLAQKMGLELSGEETCKPELQILTQANGGVPSGKGLFRQNSSNFGNGYKYSLVYKLCPKFVGQKQEMMEAFVDARNGKVYSFEDKVDYFQAKGAVYPTSNDGKSPDGVLQEGWPMPYMEVGSEITDTGGNYFASGLQTARYYGPYVDMRDNCGTDSLSGSGGIDWGSSGGTDCTTPGFGGAGNTHSSRSGFYELNKMKEIARSRLPDNTWLQGRLVSNMNINDNCNAYWNGQVNFFTAGPGCGNTGEIAAIFDHEWGHGMDANDVNGGIASPSGEGIADIYSALRLGDSCIGRGFFTDQTCTGNGDPCLDCTGVRDIDYLKHQSGQPHTLTWSESACGGGVHCLGYVYSEAVWSLWKRKLPEIYGYDDNTALEVVTRLTYIAAGNINTWFGGSAPYGGCSSGSGYLEYLVADDDNGNLGDGTPHMQAIFAAFDDQEIACDSPTVQDSGCAGTPDVAPIVTVSPGIREATLTWNNVGVDGTTIYQVFRTEGVFECGQGKVLMAETTERTFTDEGLQEGREYYYIVVPKGPSASCFGPSSLCTVAEIPELPEFTMVCDTSSVTFIDTDVPDSDVRQCELNAVGGFTGSISINCDSSAVADVDCSMSPETVTFDGGATQAFTSLTVTATGQTKGSGDVLVSAAGGGLTRGSAVTAGIIGGGGPQIALFDSSLGAPRCSFYGSECAMELDSAGKSGFDGRSGLGPESNSPNSIDGCSDGSSGSYHSDESLDDISVRSLSGEDMMEGQVAIITARVWAWSTGSSDFADFYYTSDVANPNWTFIGTVAATQGGAHDLQVEYTLPEGVNQAVRVNFRYSGSAGACTTGSYDDRDDLAFVVLPASTGDSPTKSPTPIPTTAQPTTSQPTTSQPTTSQPTASQPTTSQPTTSQPTTTQPTTSQPTTSQPTTSQPTTSQPTTSQPTTSQPTTSQPTTSQPTTTQPTTSQPTTSQPTTSQPTTSQPTTSQPTTSQPTTSQPTTSQPTTSQPTTSQPTTSQPTTSQPTSQPTPNPTPQPTNPSPSQNPTPAPTPSPVQTPAGPVEAVFDASFGAPRCSVVGSGCTSLSLLDGRGTKGPEPNQPNVISACSDGGSGVYHSDESLDRIVVESSDENGVPNGEPLKAFSTATITASVWAWTTFSNDFADFFYASDASNPTWVYIGTAQPEGSGAQEVKMTYNLPAGDNQAVRVNFRFNGVASSCSGGSYDDADDLVFAVKSGTAAPTSSPTPAPTNSPIKRTNGGPQEAVFDSLLGFPACEFYGSSCDSLEYLDGRGNVGPETNAPNTYTSDECNDGNSGQYHSDESLDKIVVMASDVDGNSIYGDMEEGGYATILAGVWAWSTGSSDRADFYYANDASNPSWNYLGTKTPPSGGAHQLTWTYQLPQGQFQAVRVVFRYGGSEVPSSSCTVGSYNDFDDLGFGVKQNSSFQFGSTSNASNSDQSKNNNGQNGSEEKVKVEPKENSKGNNGGGNASEKGKGENNRPKN